MADNNVKPIAEQIGTTTISELRDINTSLSNSDQFIVIDVKEQGEVGPSEVAKKVSYRQIRENLTNDKSVIKGIDYCFEQNDLHEDTILHIQNDAYITDNLTDGFNVKTFNPLFEDWRTVNINKIKGEGELSLSVEKEDNENILTISTKEGASQFKIDDGNGNYHAIDILKIGNGLIFQEEPNSEKITYSINLDADKIQVQGGIKVDNQIVKELIAGDNISFNTEEDQLIIASNDQLAILFNDEGKIKSDFLPNNKGEGESSSTSISYPIGQIVGNQQSSGVLKVELNGYELQENSLVLVRFSNIINTPASLNINNQGSYPIIYQNKNNFDSNLIKSQSIGLFLYSNEQYILLSVSSTVDNNIYFEENNILTTVSKNDSNYSLINSNILDNNRINSNLLPTNIITSDNINNYIQNQIPTIQGDNPIVVNNNDDTINIGLSLPSSEDASNLYLNGTGQWSTVNNLNSNLFNYIIDMFIPVGSYYETSDADFHPGQEEQGRRSGGWISETEKMAYDSIEWKLVKTYTLTNDDNSTTTVYKWHKQGIIGAG